VARELTVRCFAKINLYLDVVGRRTDEYHDIETIFQSVDLADTIRLEPTPTSTISVRCDHPDLSEPKKNIVYRAARLLQETFRVSRGAAITVEKRIPLGGGLGGGSTDAAATLRGLAELWSVPADLGTLERLAARLGADVPFCLRGGTAAATRTGTDLEPIESSRQWSVVILCPEVTVPTAEVYRRLDVRGLEPQHDRFDRAVEYVRRGDLPAALYNCMEPVVFDAYPQVRAARDALVAGGGTSALVTGTGASVYALVPTEQAARHLAGRIAPQPHRRTFVCRTVPTSS